MNNYQKQFKKDIESIKLNSTEKSELFGNFKKMMSENPAPKNEAVLSPLGSIGFRFSDLRSYAYVSLVVILVAGIGTTSAAEFSTPGDLLYPVKITINDRAVTALAFSPEAKAEAKVALVERRLAEVEDLIASNDEDDEDAQRIKYLEEKIEDYSDEAVEIIKENKEINRNKSIREKKSSENESRKVLTRLGKAIDSHKTFADKAQKDSDNTKDDSIEEENHKTENEEVGGSDEEDKVKVTTETMEATTLMPQAVREDGVESDEEDKESISESIEEIHQDLIDTEAEIREILDAKE